MDNNFESLNGKEKEIMDPLQEADMNAYQKSLEQQADNLQDAGSRRAQQQAMQQQAMQRPGMETTGSVKYEKGYYDGYADALEEINERLAADGDDYDFGRAYSGKDSRKR